MKKDLPNVTLIGITCKDQVSLNVLKVAADICQKDFFRMYEGKDYCSDCYPAYPTKWKFWYGPAWGDKLIYERHTGPFNIERKEITVPNI